MESNRIPVSVVIPFYNVEPYFRQCLESVCQQTLRHLEVICVDDRGSDGSLQIAEEFARRDPRVRIVRQDRNRGLAEARNVGLAHATGEYVAFLDSDDWVEPRTLEHMYEAAAAGDLDSVWIKVRTYLQAEGAFRIGGYYAELAATKGGTLTLDEQTLFRFPVNAWNKLYRRSIIEQHQIRFPTGLLYEDIEFHARFYTVAPTLCLLDHFYYNYRQRGGSIMVETDAGRCRVEDIYQTTGNIHDYLRAAGLWPRYRGAFAQLLLRNIRLYVHMDVYRERVLSAVRELLERIRFDESYLGFCSAKDYQLLLWIRWLRERRARRNLWLRLAGLMPSARLRRRCVNFVEENRYGW